MKGTFTKDLAVMAVLLLVLTAVTYCTRPHEASDAASFTIIYSSDMLGEVEPCG